MAILAFRLFGPLAAWGTSEAGDALRPSLRHPGRSAVFGLVAAALGLTRDQDEAHRRLAGDWALAVAAHGRRRLLRDYRTVQTAEPDRARRRTGFASRREALEEGTCHTMISRRDFVQEGLWRVFLAPRSQAADSAPLAAALARPGFDLSLGRRCCPLALPLDSRLLEVPDLDHALAAYPAVPDFGTGKELLQVLHDRLGRLAGSDWDLTWDLDFPGASVAEKWRLVRDEPVSRRRWLFEERPEGFMTRTTAPEVKT